MTLVKLKPRTSTYTISRSSMVGCFAVARARSLVPEVSTQTRLRASIDPIDSRFDLCTDFVPHEPRGRTIRLTLRGTKKMISAPACSRTMGIDFLESLAPISYGDVPSLSPPVDRIMPNEGTAIMSPSVSLIYILMPPEYTKNTQYGIIRWAVVGNTPYNSRINENRSAIHRSVDI